jgi:hypothetical protein
MSESAKPTTVRWRKWFFSGDSAEVDARRDALNARRREAYAKGKRKVGRVKRKQVEP